MPTTCWTASSAGSAWGSEIAALPRDVHAIRLRLQRIAGHGIGPGTAAAADLAVLANAAAALEPVGVAQREQCRVALIDLDDRVLRKTAATERQKSRRIDLARVTDEQDALAVADAQRGAVSAPTGAVHVALGTGQRVAALLEHEPAIVRGLGGFHGIGPRVGMVPQTRKPLLVLVRLDPLLLDAAPDGHQEERGPHGDALRGH